MHRHFYLPIYSQGGNNFRFFSITVANYGNSKLATVFLLPEAVLPTL